MRMSRERFVSLLGQLVEAVRGDDSYEGSLNYRMLKDGQFEVGCAYRVGNSNGQGGIVLVAPVEGAT